MDVPGTTPITVQLTSPLAKALKRAAAEMDEEPEELVRCALEVWLAKPVVVLDQWTPGGTQVLG